jgi:hypothetical protein
LGVYFVRNQPRDFRGRIEETLYYGRAEKGQKLIYPGIIGPEKAGNSDLARSVQQKSKPAFSPDLEIFPSVLAAIQPHGNERNLGLPPARAKTARQRLVSGGDEGRGGPCKNKP